MRDFTYVDDIVEGVIRVLDKPAFPSPSQDSGGDVPYRIFNIGNNQPVKLMAYIEAIEQALGMEARKNFLPMQPGDVPATFADTSELDAWVGFKPDTPLDTGVSRFVAWYRGYYGI
jgi:UDP-glucuronate 4-epimerase